MNLKDLEKYHIDRKKIMQEPIVNEPYPFYTAKKIDPRAGAQYRWPGQVIKETCIKFGLSEKRFYEMAKTIAKNRYHKPGISELAYHGYIYGYIYKRPISYNTLGEAKAKVKQLNEARIADNKTPNAELEIKTGMRYGKMQTKYRVLINEHRCFCPKLDNLNCFADAIDILEKSDQGFVKMTGRICVAQNANFVA